MGSYKLSEDAKSDLKRIYQYGYRKFGEDHADRYFDGLIESFEKIAKNPLSFQVIPALGSNYRRFVYFSESIYYRIDSNRIEIMAIIGRQGTAERF